MVQTIVVAIMILAGAALAQANLGGLGTPLTVALPGTARVTVTIAEMMGVAAAALVVGWFAGQIDSIVLVWRVRRREAALRATRDEITRIGAAEHDRQPSVMYVSLSNINRRLDTIEQELAGLRQRLDAALDLRARRMAMTR